MEMRRRQQLWNALVELERSYRTKALPLIQEWEASHAPLRQVLLQIADKEARLESVREEIKRRRKQTRSGKADVEELRAEARALAEELRGLRARKRELRSLLDRAQLNEKLAPLEAERERRANELAVSGGLYWANYGDVLDAWHVARRKPVARGRDWTQALHFRCWDGTGQVTVRYQYGLPVAKALACQDTRLQIEPVPEEAWTHPVRGVRRKLARTKIRLRVGSDESRRPVWLELPMVMHRPLPVNAKIREASAIREKVADSYRWKVTITVDESGPAQKCSDGKTVGIDFGWRRVRDGLRVAYWYDTDGNHGQLVIPENTLSEFARLDDLRSIRDRHFNEMREWLASWLRGRKVPEQLAEATANLCDWRSPARMAALYRRWERFDGDDEAYDRLTDWHRKDTHLWRWGRHLEDQLIKRRREQYRIFAARLAREYSFVALEALNLKNMIAKPVPEDGTQGSLPEDWYRRVAALHSLRQIIKATCAREGVAVLEVRAELTTQWCHACNHEERFDAAPQIWHTCRRCGTPWDQDYNAARNILERGLSQITGGLEQETDLRKKPKCVRRKRRD
jgi:hypothetical protein